LAYGMARQGLLPARLGRIHPRRHTPHVAIAALMIVVLVLALSGDLTALAQATSALLLAVFIVINGALLILKKRPGEPPGQFEVPSFVPAVGIVVCLLILLHVKTRALAIAGILLLVIVLLYALMRPKALTEDQLAEIAED
ncbi:MAG: amino acid permease, partial [Planctomycetes bacterium]|nr:amino acid permease [Planctomycetota bacterium]